MSRAASKVSPRLLTKAEAAEDELLSLRDAASLAFPDGRVGASGLRRERDRGRLTTYMVAGKEFTTLAAADRSAPVESPLACLGRMNHPGRPK